MECPKGYEDRMIAYAKEAIEIAVREDALKKKQPEIDASVETVISAMAPAKIDGVSVATKEEPIEEVIKG